MARELTTVIELTKTHLKLVQSKDSPDGIVLTQIIFKELTSNSPDASAKALKEAVK